MRAVLIAAAFALGVGAVGFGWHLRRAMPSAAFVMGAGGMLLVCAGTYAVLSASTGLQAYAYPSLVVTSVAGLLALAGAFSLWREHHEKDTAGSTNRTNLAIALGGGAAVALLIAWLQLFVTFVTEAQQESEKLTSEQQRVRSLREEFRFRIAITRDLTGFSPPMDPGDPDKKLDLSGLGLRGKELPSSNFEDVRLHGSDLVEANLFGSRMRGARLDRAAGPRTDLRAATLRGADLRNARLNDVNLTEADLRSAFVHGADFTGARLDWADLRGLSCAEDTNAPRDCTEKELVDLGLPPAGRRPSTACFPPMDPDIRGRPCGAQARKIYDSDHPRP